MPPFQLKDGTLTVHDAPLLSGLPETVTLVDDPQGVGVFLRFTSEKPLSQHVFALGELQNAPTADVWTPLRAVLDEGGGGNKRRRRAARNTASACGTGEWRHCPVRAPD